MGNTVTQHVERLVVEETAERTTLVSLSSGETECLTTIERLQIEAGSGHVIQQISADLIAFARRHNQSGNWHRPDYQPTPAPMMKNLRPSLSRLPGRSVGGMGQCRSRSGTEHLVVKNCHEILESGCRLVGPSPPYGYGTAGARHEDLRNDAQPTMRGRMRTTASPWSGVRRVTASVCGYRRDKSSIRRRMHCRVGPVQVRHCDDYGQIAIADRHYRKAVEQQPRCRPSARKLMFGPHADGPECAGRLLRTSRRIVHKVMPGGTE